MSYAIIEAGGKQFWVEPGKFYDLDHIPLEPGDKITFNKVLLVNKDGQLNIGYPCIKNITIEGTLLRHFKDKKVIVYKDKPKKQARSKRGFRRLITRVQIESF
uniref:Large ribosomal subunit protein bL21c n=1 Tax=Bulboplastis apyrenoidosa TaxID=1070855 RepID=A0A1Y9TMB7_9RHOD|nr:50S ribosomal protein L21 [Bulboplastis apyrenoidosa]ARO90825.1 50S ribosomal protein L21 [Bulboplastis apyrenoidosa]